jgi:hypothetical protein
MLPLALIRQYAVGQQIDSAVADLEFPRYGGHLLTERGLVGEDVRYAECSAVFVGVP